MDESNRIQLAVAGLSIKKGRTLLQMDNWPTDMRIAICEITMRSSVDVMLGIYAGLGAGLDTVHCLAADQALVHHKTVPMLIDLEGPMFVCRQAAECGTLDIAIRGYVASGEDLVDVARQSLVGAS